jgi:hypothetical protein
VQSLSSWHHLAFFSVLSLQACRPAFFDLTKDPQAFYLGNKLPTLHTSSPSRAFAFPPGCGFVISLSSNSRLTLLRISPFTRLPMSEVWLYSCC